MTVSVNHVETLRRLLMSTEALLLDFDGPVCSVFAGFPAVAVAHQLREVLADCGHIDLPPRVQAATDPFEVLRHAAELGDEESRYVEAAFTAHELESIASAEPTPGAAELMTAWNAKGLPLSIVSNNSKLCVEAYLIRHDLQRYVNYLACRSTSDVKRLKPNTYLIKEATLNVMTTSDKCILIGDSPSDIQAASKANVRSIGFANKPGKVDVLQIERPDAITTSIELLTREL